MRIIVAGAGEVGTYLAKLLCDEQHDVVVIDTDNNQLKNLDNYLDILTVKGSATSIGILKDAQIKRTDLFIAVTPSEEINITASILGKKLGAKKTIARVDNMEYLLPTNSKFFNSLGIDSLIYPELLAAREIITLLKQTGTSKVFEFAGGKISLFAIKLGDKAPILNKTLMEVSNDNESYEYRAVAIIRNGETIIPRGTDRFLKQDLVYVITTQAGINHILKHSGKKHFNVNNLMILGGSRIGKKSANELENQYNIKLLEINRDKCFNLADELKKTLVLNADGRDINTLMEEGLKQMDAFVAVTGNSETNILSCLHAQRVGVKKAIAEIENMDYIPLAENLGIDTIINKKLIAASNIFRHTVNAEVNNVQCLWGTDAEVIEFVVKEKAPSTKTSIRHLDFPKGAIIGGIVRGNETFIAKGDCVMEAGDKVVVFALPQFISRVAKLFT